MVWRGTDVSHSQGQKELSKARWSPFFSISQIPAPAESWCLKQQGFQQSLEPHNRIGVKIPKNLHVSKMSEKDTENLTWKSLSPPLPGLWPG